MKGWVKRRVCSFGHAFRGIRFVALHERNGKYHIAHVAACALAMPFVGPLPATFALVALGSECMNTALERAVDLATDGERKGLAKISKDAASAAVLCCLAASALTDLWCVLRLICEG